MNKQSGVRTPSYKCTICSHVFEGMDYNPNIILEHYSVHKKDDPEISIPLEDDLKVILKPAYECSLCGQYFVYRSQWERHMINDHSIAKPYKCDKCDFATHSIKSLKYHQDTHVNHIGVKSFKCDLCDYASKNLFIGIKNIRLIIFA